MGVGRSISYYFMVLDMRPICFRFSHLCGLLPMWPLTVTMHFIFAPMWPLTVTMHFIIAFIYFISRRSTLSEMADRSSEVGEDGSGSGDGLQQPSRQVSSV